MADTKIWPETAATTKLVSAAKNAMPPASPSRPSMRLTALTSMPTIHKKGHRHAEDAHLERANPWPADRVDAVACDIRNCRRRKLRHELVPGRNTTRVVENADDSQEQRPDEQLPRLAAALGT